MKPTIHVLALALAAALAGPALAQTGPEAAIAPRIIAHECLDIREDLNGCESVLLLASETEPDGADLLIYPDRRTDDATGPLLIVRNVAFNGAMWGMAPSLGRADNGSLYLNSEQIGVGRTPWSQTLTVAWRGGRFVVAGFTYTAYDRLNGRNFSCDINMLTGDFESRLIIPDMEDNGAEEEVIRDTGRVGPMAVALADWTAFRGLPEPCATASAGLYDD